MKSFIVLALVVAVAVAAPADSKGAYIVRNDFDNLGLGKYGYISETSDGKSVQEEGTLKNIGTEDEALEVVGKFAYIGPDGVEYKVSYTANENGFQPQGSHIPA